MGEAFSNFVLRGMTSLDPGFPAGGAKHGIYIYRERERERVGSSFYD